MSSNQVYIKDLLHDMFLARTAGANMAIQLAEESDELKEKFTGEDGELDRKAVERHAVNQAHGGIAAALSYVVADDSELMIQCFTAASGFMGRFTKGDAVDAVVVLNDAFFDTGADEMDVVLNSMTGADDVESFMVAVSVDPELSVPMVALLSAELWKWAEQEDVEGEEEEVPGKLQNIADLKLTGSMLEFVETEASTDGLGFVAFCYSFIFAVNAVKLMLAKQATPEAGMILMGGTELSDFAWLVSFIRWYKGTNDGLAHTIAKMESVAKESKRQDRANKRKMAKYR